MITAPFRSDSVDRSGEEMTDLSDQPDSSKEPRAQTDPEPKHEGDKFHGVGTHGDWSFGQEK